MCKGAILCCNSNSRTWTKSGKPNNRMHVAAKRRTRAPARLLTPSTYVKKTTGALLPVRKPERISISSSETICVILRSCSEALWIGSADDDAAPWQQSLHLFFPIRDLRQGFTSPTDFTLEYARTKHFMLECAKDQEILEF
jgi:hypothetical protein